MFSKIPDESSSVPSVNFSSTKQCSSVSPVSGFISCHKHVQYGAEKRNGVDILRLINAIEKSMNYDLRLGWCSIWWPQGPAGSGEALTQAAVIWRTGGVRVGSNTSSGDLKGRRVLLLLLSSSYSRLAQKDKCYLGTFSCFLKLFYFSVIDTRCHMSFWCPARGLRVSLSRRAHWVSPPVPTHSTLATPLTGLPVLCLSFPWRTRSVTGSWRLPPEAHRPAPLLRQPPVCSIYNSALVKWLSTPLPIR